MIGIILVPAFATMSITVGIRLTIFTAERAKGEKMDERDKALNELRRENSRLRAELDNLRWMQSRTDKTDLGDAIQTIYECCRNNETCKACPLNNDYGCTITGSPYEWRFPKP